MSVRSTARRPGSTPTGALTAVLLAAALTACASGPPASSGDPATAPDAPVADPVTTVPGGWVWTFRADPPRALFGPPASEAVLVVECRAESSGDPRVVHTLYAPADSGATAELVVSGNGERVRVPVRATATELGPAWIWQGAVAPERTAAPFTAGDGPVSFAVEGSATWSVPDPHPVREVLGACSPQKGSPTPK
ncbi:MAG: hypothetical protein RLN75_02300 [Longimicrobiales bacterium]